MTSILVGDIGGTNARFGIGHQDSAGHISIDHYKKYAGDDFYSLTDVIETYLSDVMEQPEHISLAVAGPIRDDEAKLTNRDWKISKQAMCDIRNIKHAKLYNDFTAMSRSIPELNDQDFEHIYDTVPDVTAPILVAGPGTGFGVGYVVPIATGWKVISTEGGHMAYAPQNDVEREIQSILQADHDFVSIELVSSGSGLIPVHKAVCQRHGATYNPIEPADIKSQAANGDVICQEICDIRSNATMGALGDLALTGGATGGVVIAGGVAERMIDLYQAPTSMARFFNKGSHSNYMKQIPIRLLTNPLAPLIGAAALYLDDKYD